MVWIHLDTTSINSIAIATIDWGTDEKPAEEMPSGTTEVANPNAGVSSPQVAVVRLLVQLNDTPLSIVIDRNSDDFKKLKAALGKS